MGATATTRRPVSEHALQRPAKLGANPNEPLPHVTLGTLLEAAEMLGQADRLLGLGGASIVQDGEYVLGLVQGRDRPVFIATEKEWRRALRARAAAGRQRRVILPREAAASDAFWAEARRWYYIEGLYFTDAAEAGAPMRGDLWVGCQPTCAQLVQEMPPEGTVTYIPADAAALRAHLEQMAGEVSAPAGAKP